MRETAEQVRKRLVMKAQADATGQLLKAQSICASDAALINLNFTLKHIDAMTDAQLLQRAIEAPSEPGEDCAPGA